MRKRRTPWIVGLVLAGAIASGTVAAAEPAVWEFEFMPYAWIPGNFGTLDVNGRSAQVDVTVHDALDIATSGNAMFAAGYLGARYDRWIGFIDAFGGYAEERVNERIPTQFCCSLSVAATADIRPVIVDAALGYRIGQWSLPDRQRPITFDAYAGTRFMHFGSKLSASTGVVGAVQHSANVSDTFNWADPMIGLRWEIPVLDDVTVHFRGDIGGFGASSDLIWGLVGDARYWLGWHPFSLQPWLSAGYRAVAFDRSFGSGDGLDLEFRGPFAGMGIVF